MSHPLFCLIWLHKTTDLKQLENYSATARQNTHSHKHCTAGHLISDYLMKNNKLQLAWNILSMSAWELYSTWSKLGYQHSTGITLFVSGKHHQPVYISISVSVKWHSCRMAETWAGLSRMVDRGRKCPFKIWQSLIPLGRRETVHSMGLW